MARESFPQWVETPAPEDFAVKRRREQAVEPQVLAQWRGRSGALQRRLADAPAAGEAWFWQIQWNIVNYLLERYAHEPAPATTEPGAESMDTQSDEALSHTALEVRSSDSFREASESGSAPRASERMRPVLQEIAEANRDRYAEHQRASMTDRELRRRELEAARQELLQAGWIDEWRPLIVDAQLEPGMLSDDEIRRSSPVKSRWNRSPKTGTRRKMTAAHESELDIVTT